MTGAVLGVDRFSHGTLESRSLDRLRPFLRDFLGMDGVRVAPEALYVYLGGPWLVVCVEAGDALQPQGRENSWLLNVGAAEDVDAMHDKALASIEKYDLREVGDVEESGRTRSFVIQDRDGNWWNIYHKAAPPEAEWYEQV